MLTDVQHDEPNLCITQMGMAGATRKANFVAPVRGAYTGVGAARTANRPAAELGNWSTTYTNSYEVLSFYLGFSQGLGLLFLSDRV